MTYVLYRVALHCMPMTLGHVKGHLSFF